ncbi:MAG: hypothetical protein Ta2D_03190 [Rickettsiales bacterium]|nr:MAG: hypothetical protein Ta2D_03190 [Rickettsiales bacterium]
MNNKLILIDGYSVLFRLYFATKERNIKSGALEGFTRSVRNIKRQKHTHLAVVFDCGKKTFRHDMSPDYKANRPNLRDTEPDLIPQFKSVRDVVKIMNIPILEKEGYEADDIIATFAKKAEANNFEVCIVGIDKDLMQLINDNIIMLDVFKGKEIIERDVIEKWGVQPNQLLDLFSLIGDASDNVPGVKGIGPITAANLINEFGTLDNLISNIENIKKLSTKNKLKSDLDNLFLSKNLIRLCENVELDITLNDCVSRNYNDSEVDDFLQKYNGNDRFFI